MAPLPKSRRKLEPSKLARQIEFLHDTIPTDELRLVTKGRTFLLSESIIGGDVNRTIDGASTLKLTVSDYYSRIRNSGMLGNEVDIKLDGLWFRLVAVSKTGYDLELTFESREVAILRTYNKKRVVGWGKMSRARFVQILMNESPQTRLIPFVCPELVPDKKIKDEDDRFVNREYGFGARKPAPRGVTAAEGTTTGNGKGDVLYVKSAVATADQQYNIGAVIQEGLNQVSITNKHQRKILVCAIMTIIQESTATNLYTGHGTSVGLFQIIDIHGTVEQRRDIPWASEWFYSRAIKADAADPGLTYNDLCQTVQRSGHPDEYGQWRNQAERWVSAYGVVGGDSHETEDVSAFNLMSDWEQDATAFQFQRGTSKTLPGGKKGWTKEDTWACMNRLAEEVNWRCFEVSGMVYFISEPKLFKSGPRARIDEQSPGIDWIDFNYDVGKASAQVTIQGRAGQWAAPPGTVVEVMNNGPVNGRWLVTDINRGIFSPDVNITCKKPRAKLPEPTQASETGGLWDNIWTGEEDIPTKYTHTPRQTAYPIGKRLREGVLNHPNVKFQSATQSMDITMNLIHEDVLTFLFGFMEAGFTAEISSLKTGHSTNVKGTNRPSAHSVGRAVDMGNYSTVNGGDTRTAMLWIRDYQVQFGWSQLIGPIEELVVPFGYYGRETLDGHKDHIHVGWVIL